MSASRPAVRRGVAGSRAVLVVVAVAVLSLVGATTASAFWTVPVAGGGAPAQARAASLVPPASVTAVQSTSTPTSVQVSWTSPASQLPGARYTVTRTIGTGAGAVVCTAVATTSCTDNGLAAGSAYGWSVVAVIGANWRSVAVTASATLLGVTTTSLASGNVGSLYSQALAAVGGTGGYTWAVTAGTLPAGLSLAPATGIISGTPTVGGTTTGLRFTVTDGAGRTATSAPLSLTILKRVQTITVTNAPASGDAGTTWTPAVTASSGLPVTIAVDTSTGSNCSVSPTGVVTFLAVSACRINFDQAGNGAFEPAPRVPVTITVNRGNQTITFVAPIDAAVGGVVPLPITASSGLPVTLSSSTLGVCTVSGLTVTYVTTGTCTLTASVAGTVNFFPATLMRSFTVSTPAGLGIAVVSGTGTPVVSCTSATVTATRTCTLSGVGLSGSATVNVVVLSSVGNRVVFSYTTPRTVTQTGQNTGTATIAAGTSITSTTLTASHVGNAPKTSTFTFGTYTLTLTVVT